MGMRRITNVLLPGLMSVLAFAPALTGCAAPPRVPAPACATVAAPAGADQATVRIELVTVDQVAGVVLEDSKAARELLAVLPMTIDLRDSFGLAMVGSMPTSLDTGSAPVSCSFQVGEIGYSPSDGAVAIFHSAEAAQLETPGAVRLGRVTNGLSTITAPGVVQVTVRRAG